MVLKKESIMNQPMELSLEQEFNQTSFTKQVQRMSQKEAQEFALKLYEEMMLRESRYKAVLRKIAEIHETLAIRSKEDIYKG